MLQSPSGDRGNFVFYISSRLAIQSVGRNYYSYYYSFLPFTKDPSAMPQGLHSTAHDIDAVL